MCKNHHKNLWQLSQFMTEIADCILFFLRAKQLLCQVKQHFGCISYYYFRLRPHRIVKDNYGKLSIVKCFELIHASSKHSHSVNMFINELECSVFLVECKQFVNQQSTMADITCLSVMNVQLSGSVTQNNHLVKESFC